MKHPDQYVWFYYSSVNRSTHVSQKTSQTDARASARRHTEETGVVTHVARALWMYTKETVLEHTYPWDQSAD